MRPAFTLIELVIVITIVAIVSAVAIPIAQERLTSAQQSATIEQMQLIQRACVLHRVQHGRWPSDRPGGVVPPEIAAAFEDIDFSRTPIGGVFDWNGPGTNVGHYGISVRLTGADLRRDVLRAIDSQLDDGDLGQGKIQLFSGRYFQFCVD